MSDTLTTGHVGLSNNCIELLMTAVLKMLCVKCRNDDAVATRDFFSSWPMKTSIRSQCCLVSNCLSSSGSPRSSLVARDNFRCMLPSTFDLTDRPFRSSHMSIPVDGISCTRHHTLYYTRWILSHHALELQKNISRWFKYKNLHLKIRRFWILMYFPVTAKIQIRW